MKDEIYKIVNEDYVNPFTGEVENLEDKYGVLTIMLYKLYNNVPLNDSLADKLKLKRI